MYMNEDVNIHGYFSNRKGVRQQNSLGNTVLDYSLREIAVFYRKFALSRACDVTYSHCALNGQGY